MSCPSSLTTSLSQAKRANFFQICQSAHRWRQHPGAEEIELRTTPTSFGLAQFSKVKSQQTCVGAGDVGVVEWRINEDGTLRDTKAIDRQAQAPVAEYFPRRRVHARF
jgi:hypothetical protein